MYRCYLIRNGRIAIGDDLDGETLAKALAHGRRLIAARSKTETFSGMEIWCGASLVYSDACYADGDGTPPEIDSPFQTPESTILPNWRPSLGRSILAIRSAASQAAPPVVDGNAQLPTPDADTPSQVARPRKAVRRKPVRSPIAA